MPDLPEPADLDDAQRKGVESDAALTVIMAGAGTGKTLTVTRRIARLLEGGADPASIVAATFTRDAAEEMRARTEALVGDAARDVRFGTLHALAARILRRMWQAAGLESPDFSIADDDERASAMKEAVEASGTLPGPIQGEEAERRRALDLTAKEALKRIGRWKENGLTLAAALDPDRPRRGMEDEDTVALWEGYERAMAARGLLEFADLTPMAVAALEADPEGLDREAGSVGHLLVDEWQDTNAVQLALVRLLSSAGASVTATGDDDQLIYSWRGAVPRLMERTHEHLPLVAARGVARVRLVTNRRCTDDVLRPANLMVDYNPRDEPKVLSSGRSGSPVSVSAHADDQAEANDIAARIGALVAAGESLSSIAVLSRGRSIAGGIGKALVRARIPHEMQAGTSFLERTEVKDLMAYLKLAANPSQDFAFHRIAARPARGIGPDAAGRVTALSAERRIPIHEALALLAPEMRGKAKQGASDLSRQLAAMSSACDADVPAEDMLLYALDTVGYRDWAGGREDAPATLRDSIDALLDMARARASLIEFLEDASLSGDAEARSRGAVHVGTLHGSKGLEWDHVFLPGFEDGIIPSARAIEEAASAGDASDPWNVASAGGLGEERRLAHVGLTRSRVSAHVSFAAMRRGRPMRPSRLLREAELEVPRAPRMGAADPASRASARGQAKKRAAFW